MVSTTFLGDNKVIRDVSRRDESRLAMGDNGIKNGFGSISKHFGNDFVRDVV